MIEFKEACPIGNYCFSAQFLKEVGVRTCSYPFDWLFTSVSSTTHILKDDFVQFMNKDNFIDVQDVVPNQNGRQAGHKLYHPNFFNHKNPREDKDYQYYERCIDRFRTFLKSKEPKLFMVAYKNSDIPLNSTHYQDLASLYMQLEKVTSNFHLFVHINYPFKTRKSEIKKIRKMIIHEFWSEHVNHGLGYYLKEDQEEFEKVFHSNFKSL